MEDMMDRIRICDLLARCILGINEGERREKQDVLINLAIYTDLRKAGKSDRIEDTVDYRALKKRVLAMVEGSQYFLEEALADAVAELCLGQQGVRQVDVRGENHPQALSRPWHAPSSASARTSNPRKMCGPRSAALLRKPISLAYPWSIAPMRLTARNSRLITIAWWRSKRKRPLRK